MKKNKKIYFVMFLLSIIASIIFIIAFGGMIGGYGKILSGSLDTRSKIMIVFCISLCVFSYLSCLFYSKYKNDKKYMKMGLLIYFIIYCILFFFLTTFARKSNFIFNLNISNLKELFSNANFVPLKSTIELIKLRINLPFANELSLVLGNVLLLLPLAFFLPRLFQKQNQFKIFCFTILIINLSLEIFQIITSTGVFDIDDIILNSIGAIIGFYIFNKTFVCKVLNKVFLLSCDKLNKGDIIKSVIVISIIIMLLGISIYHYFYATPGFEIEIINEKDYCGSDKQLIYEDKDYFYYIPTDCSDSIYIVFNKKNKYLLKDYINGKVKSKYNLYFRVEDLRTFGGVEVISKNYEFDVSYENSDIHIEYEIDNLDILTLKNTSVFSKEGKKVYRYTVYAKKDGIVKVKFNILNDNDLIDTIEKLFKVDQDLNVNEISNL